ncbi:hypothetical protein BC835DRAFT_1309733 [Cytidiella melzeri]|nr:hypothetical protein BC835DRAFT_1309733 [Cytidiella melzeri]
MISTVKCTLTQDEGMRNKHTQPNETERKRAERWDGEEEQRDEIERMLPLVLTLCALLSRTGRLLLAPWLPGSLAPMLYLTTLEGLLSDCIPPPLPGACAPCPNTFRGLLSEMLSDCIPPPLPGAYTPCPNTLRGLLSASLRVLPVSSPAVSLSPNLSRLRCLRIAYLLRSLVPTCCVQTPYEDFFRLAYSAYPASVVFSYLPFAQSSALEIRKQRVVSMVARCLESAVAGGNVEGTSRLEFDNLEQILSYEGLCLARTVAGCGFWPDCESGDEPLRKRLTTIRTLGVYVDYLAMVTEVGMPSGCGKWVLSFVCAAYSSGVNMISASFATDGLEQGVDHSPRDFADSIGIQYLMLSRPNVTSDIAVVAVPTGVSSVIWFASVSTAQASHGEHGIDMFRVLHGEQIAFRARRGRWEGTYTTVHSEDRTGTVRGNTRERRAQWEGTQRG